MGINILPLGIARGMRGFFRGLRWLRGHPFYMLLLFLPILLGLFFLTAVWTVIWRYHDVFFSFLLYERPDVWWSLIFYYLLKAILYVAIIMVSLLVYVLFLNVISSPIYDRVSFAIEKDLLGRAPFEISFTESLGLMGEELKKSLVIMAINIGVLCVPVLNALSPLVAAFCLGWEVYDFPLARRGWSFRERAAFVLAHGWSVIGLGVFLIIPGVQIVMVPLAVAGGTILAVEDLGTSMSHIKKGVIK